jgi:hypothetical protein
VAERISGEYLGAEDDEVADQSAGERDRGTGQERATDELNGDP